MQAVPAALVGDTRAVEVRGGVVERQAAGELERLVVEAGLASLDSGVARLTTQGWLLLDRLVVELDF